MISLLSQEDLHLLGSGSLGSAGRSREAIFLDHIPVDLGLGGLAVPLPPHALPILPFIRSRKEIGLGMILVVTLVDLIVLIGLLDLISEIQRGLKPTG